VDFDDVVRLTTHLPGVAEGTSYGTRALRTGRRFMCRLREDGDTLVLTPIDEIQQRFLMETQPDIFYKTPHYEGYDTILIRLSRVDESELRELLEQCWQSLATKSLLKAREAAR
jgi:hypothetical protein